MAVDRSRLTTEKCNPRSGAIDTLSPAQIVELIAAEDAKVAPAVRRQRGPIAKLAEIIAGKLRGGGRLLYVGAGTSGRLGVLDAAECPPTFGTRRRQVQGIIAGGRRALVRSIEGAEDSAADGEAAVRKHKVSAGDVVVGIAACGLTPFVRGAVAAARKTGAATGFVTCSPEVAAHIKTGVTICVNVGPEVITGSTRMKAGTATKLVLNMLTTTAMVLLGKVYGHWMVDLTAVNEKLRDRAERILMELAGVSRAAARKLLQEAKGKVKPALLMGRRGVGYARARRLLQQAGGSLRRAMEEA